MAGAVPRGTVPGARDKAPSNPLYVTSARHGSGGMQTSGPLLTSGKKEAGVPAPGRAAASQRDGELAAALVCITGSPVGESLAVGTPALPSGASQRVFRLLNTPVTFKAAGHLSGPAFCH